MPRIKSPPVGYESDRPASVDCETQRSFQYSNCAKIPHNVVSRSLGDRTESLAAGAKDNATRDKPYVVKCLARNIAGTILLPKTSVQLFSNNLCKRFCSAAEAPWGGFCCHFLRPCEQPSRPLQLVQEANQNHFPRLHCPPFRICVPLASKVLLSIILSQGN
jgi:hypothetical protein